MKNILITGGAGYIGSILTEKLLIKGYNVTILDNFKWGIIPILHLINNPKLEIINGDIRDNKHHKILTKFDSIINLAGIVGYPACDADKWEAYDVNVKSVKEWTSKISKNQIFIQASTGSSYGKVEGICTEETPINPLTIYGSNKAEAEKYLTDCNGISLRFATLYGISPRLRLDLLVNQIVLSALKDGYYVLYQANFSRTFLSVQDTALSIVFAIDNFTKMRGECYNIGSNDQNFTKLEVANLIKNYVNYNLINNEFSKDKDQRDYEVSYKKIADLGFERKFSLEDGINELIKVCKILQEKSIFRNF